MVQERSYMASLAKWLSVRLRTKWFWVRVQLQSVAIQTTIERVFTLKCVLDMIRTYMGCFVDRQKSITMTYNEICF